MSTAGLRTVPSSIRKYECFLGVLLGKSSNFIEIILVKNVLLADASKAVNKKTNVSPYSALSCLLPMKLLNQLILSLSLRIIEKSINSRAS